MTVKEKVEGFLSSVKSFSIGYNGINFFAPEDVAAEQQGYSMGADGKPLSMGKRGDWKEEWLVIGYEELNDDPVFVNMKTTALKVSTAQHGERGWEPFFIADSLDNLKGIVEQLQTVAKGRTTPEELEANPITDEERKTVIAELKKQNPYSEIWYWESFLENA